MNVFVCACMNMDVWEVSISMRKVLNERTFNSLTCGKFWLAKLMYFVCLSEEKLIDICWECFAETYVFQETAAMQVNANTNINGMFVCVRWIESEKIRTESRYKLARIYLHW